MGIPSYFKHILDRYPRLLAVVNEDSKKADILLMDFNCLIYGVIRGPGMPTYSHATRDAWETAALRAVNEYVVEVWNAAGRPAQVYMAVDGVVPMAKMRQQRLRRFKSVWMAAKERELGVRAPGQEMWDTNAITPGTAFMERLGTSLRGLCAARGAGWSVSGADEEGEGEQKLMAWVRGQGAATLAGKQIMVYGLDADLIVLCLLHAGVIVPGAQWAVLRERQEFGNAASTSAQVKFLTLDVNGLLEVMWPCAATRVADIYDYVCGMSLLGNDFLPHSMTINIRLGGHDLLLSDLGQSGSARLTKIEEGRGVVVNPDGLRRILKTWSATEDEDMLRGIQRKYKMRGPPPRSEAERAMVGVQNLPLEWAAEDCLWSSTTGTLHVDWRDRYYAEHAPAALEDIAARCRGWCAGLQWILDYYTGQRAVSRTWYYAWSHPPLWNDLAVFVETPAGALPQPPVASAERPVQPQEQLAIVLPMESWGLIRDVRLRCVPAHAPAFWPTSFEFESLGKRWMWECEPQIPILTPARLRAVLSANTY